MSVERELVPTRSMLLELQAEHEVVLEGRSFLDHQQRLLAAELLRQAEAAERALRTFERLCSEAREATRLAIGRHGLEALLLRPAEPLDPLPLEERRRNYLGVLLLEVRLRLEEQAPPAAASNPSPEALRAAERHRELLANAAELAALSGNIQRLRLAYIRCERRVRALEDVIEPELGAQIHRIGEELEEQDREEIVRARRHGPQRDSRPRR
ncbi:MAG: hypothetical protein OEY14_05545 [Myxococcales bacterium]|nr:hypothetical protein [Myxococcales bacterium]